MPFKCGIDKSGRSISCTFLCVRTCIQQRFQNAQIAALRGHAKCRESRFYRQFVIRICAMRKEVIDNIFVVLLYGDK